MTDDGTDTAEHLQIGAVATETGLSIKTIRHYDEVGSVVPSARSAGASGCTPGPTSIGCS